MKRRTFLATALAATNAVRLSAALEQGRWDAAAEVLRAATESQQIDAAVLHVVHRGQTWTHCWGKATSPQAMFLLGSISKPINVTALMTLFDRKLFQLDDRVQKYLPGFSGEGREGVTIRHLLTHVSGLPDQLPENSELRRRRAPLAEFVERTRKTPLAFAPGTRYQYSSMGILLAAHIAERLMGVEIRALVEQQVFRPLEMQHSAQGLGRFGLSDMNPCQTQGAAPEAGGGDPQAKDWDWNSSYWRTLGAPWGGTHASAPDVGRFLEEFLSPRGRAVQPETARLMISNHNPAPLPPRGLGFAVGTAAGSKGCSEHTFGHTGSTGTLCWADPRSETVCVVLTSLPARAVQPHPRERAAEYVAAAARRG
uniref:Class A beta-lactamase-related serine hydrolase n=1 Tax=Schlesneria paludicola TaxID=360056 RepID=A0A7C4LM62_9PLAN